MLTTTMEQMAATREEVTALREQVQDLRDSVENLKTPSDDFDLNALLFLPHLSPAPLKLQHVLSKHQEQDQDQEDQKQEQGAAGQLIVLRKSSLPETSIPDNRWSSVFLLMAPLLVRSLLVARGVLIDQQRVLFTNNAVSVLMYRFTSKRSSIKLTNLPEASLGKMKKLAKSSSMKLTAQEWVDFIDLTMEDVLEGFFETPNKDQDTPQLLHPR